VLHHAFWSGDAVGQTTLKAYLTSSAGTTSSALWTDTTNATTTSGGSLPRQVAALTLSVRFSGAEGGTPAGLGKLIYRKPGDALDGFSIEQILAAANQALGTGTLPRGYTFSGLNDFITRLNESFVDSVASTWAKRNLSRK